MIKKEKLLLRNELLENKNIAICVITGPVLQWKIIIGTQKSSEVVYSELSFLRWAYFIKVPVNLLAFPCSLFV